MASSCSKSVNTRTSEFVESHIFSCWSLQNSTETKGRKSQIFCAEGESFPRCDGQEESKLARVSRASYGKRCLAYPLLSQHQGAIGETWGALKTPWQRLSCRLTRHYAPSASAARQGNTSLPGS